MTLLELLLATSIMLLVAGTLGAVARGVQMGFEYSQGYETTTQHGRVVLERIRRRVEGATVSEQFPGVLVLATEIGTWRFPDTLVVWSPSGQAADPQGLPRYNELAIYCPEESVPHRLVEITVPDDARTVPSAGDLTRWHTEIQAIRRSNARHQAVLTELLRTSAVSDWSGADLRGAVRFETRLRPSAAQWSQYKAGTLAWKDLPWTQGMYGARTGLRQIWLRMEVQLMPDGHWVANSPAARQPVPFFGSAGLYCEMRR